MVWKTRPPLLTVRSSIALSRLALKRAAFSLMLLLGVASGTLAQSVNPDLWTPDGEVFTLVRDSGVIYIGGDFLAE